MVDNKKQTELMSLRAYSRYRGVTLSAVQKAIASRRIFVTYDYNGKKKIDPKRADIDWERNTDIAYSIRYKWGY